MSRSIRLPNQPELVSKVRSDPFTVDDHFKAYLQFQPSTGGSIPVTIQRIDWSWTCGAAENGGIWTWSLSTNGPAWNNDDSFPVWPQVYHNQE